MDELSALYPKKTLYEMYQLAVNDEDYSFWYVLSTAKSRDDTFWISFEKNW